MAYGILLLEDIASIKIAVEICNNTDFKAEILRASSGIMEIYIYDCKRLWNRVIEKKATKILSNLQLTKKLREKIIAVVFAVGMRMLTWAEYHEGTFGFTRDYSINFLNRSLFTSQGIIDNQKAATELMNGTNLSIMQKYKLACVYCFTDHIPSLYRQMSNEDKKMFYDVRGPEISYQHGLIQFWSYYLMSEVDKIKGEKSIDEFRFEKAIESGNIAAVEYCLTLRKRRKEVIVNAALEAIVHSTIKDYDWIVFRKRRYDDKSELWTPRDYYVDILCFLLSKMKPDQREDFLKKDITGDKYKNLLFKRDRRPPSGISGTNIEDLHFERRRHHSKTLEHFLNWPYQNYFMKTAELVWEFLPESDYAVLLMKICEKAMPHRYRYVKYGEEKSYNYQRLFKEFWLGSPTRFKQFIFSNQEVEYIRDKKIKIGEELLLKLLTSTNSTKEDRKNVKLVLECATEEERQNLITFVIASSKWKISYIDIISEWKWEKMEVIVTECFPSQNEVRYFKKGLSFMMETIFEMINLLGSDNFDKVESFITWSSLPEEEIQKLKIEIISSYSGKQKCVNLFCYKNNTELANKILKWCFPSEEHIRKYKSGMIYSEPATRACRELIRGSNLQTIDNFVKWCLFSLEKINEFKKHLVKTHGNFICETLISGLVENIDNLEEYLHDYTEFEGGKWEQLDEFLLWSFSSEEDINNFKRNKLFKESSMKIHFKLIKSNQMEEAVKFFAWLNLSDEEIKKIKTKTLYAGAPFKMLLEFVHHEDDDKIYSKFGSKQEALELLLRWYLTDKETALEFRDKFKPKYREDYAWEENENNLKNFDLLIEQYLKEFDK